MPKRVLCVLMLLLLGKAAPLRAQAGRTLFVEDFRSLADWRPLYFPKIERHSRYEIEKHGARSYLKALSDASASGLVYKKEFNVYDFPALMWRWKVENVYEKGTINTKEGDDYPLRIYVMFKYDPQRAAFWERLKYEAAKLLYGEYPPHSSLNYVWANKEHIQDVVPSPYTDKAMMILLQKGRRNLGRWVIQQVDLLQDYRRAFHASPPPVARIAVMNDSDNTAESSTSYVDYIQVYRPRD